MSKVLVTEQYLSNIASAIRQKLGGSATYYPANMAQAIRSIASMSAVLKSKSISQNGIYSAASENADGFATVVVNMQNTFTANDSGKVVSGNSLAMQSAKSVSVNGIYDTTYNNQIVVSVSGGTSATLIPKSITSNGTYDPASDDADGYSGVVVNVPNTFNLDDEGKVVVQGSLVEQGTETFSSNGTYDTTMNDEVVVNVPATPSASLISRSFSANGSYNAQDDNADGYSDVVIAVPNTYSAADEGKVVASGALSTQGSRTILVNGTYDTTLYSQIIASISGGGSAILVSKSISQNGTYTATDDDADGYSQVVVDISTLPSADGVLFGTVDPDPPTPPTPVTPADDEAYMGDSTITSFYDSSVTSIGQRAFMSCENLKEVGFSSCEMVGSSAFSGCYSLKSVDLPNCTTIGKDAFSRCYSLTDLNISSVEEIGQSAFASCTSLSEVDIPECTVIGSSAFDNCRVLQSVNMSKVISIYNDAFAMCDLSTLSLPDCEFIGSHAFEWNINLESVYLPSCKLISTGAFWNCANFITSTYSTSSYYVGISAVDLPECSDIWFSAFKECSNITSVSIPHAVIVGGFESCINLESISLPLAETLRGDAFINCTKLSDISVPNVVNVGSGIGSVFGNCVSLSCISFPLAETMQGKVFEDCVNLESVYLMGSVFCSLSTFASTNIFSGCTKMLNGTGRIYVRQSLLSTYQENSRWKYFSSQFVGVS